MKIYRPLWSDGVFLVPQQFQQQAAWHTCVAENVAHMVLGHPWGVISAQFDESALALQRLHATSIIVRFPDGTLIDSVIADNLPPACDLSGMADCSQADVLLALPLLSANGGNLDDGRDSERVRRWKQEWVEVQDLCAEERTELAVLRHAVTLRFAHQENSAYLTCPVARLVRNTQAQWVLDNSFIPPMLALSASNRVLIQLGELLHRMQARRSRLMAMRRESNERLADFAVADVSLFWLLNALNSAEPVLAELYQTPSRHPELLYRELARLAGSLLTFSLTHDASAIPRYYHETPEQVFVPLFSLLDTLLESSLPSRIIAVELVRSGQFWKGALHDARLREGADFYLSVRSSLSAAVLQSQFPLLCKAGSPDEVSDVVNVALSGVPIKALSHVPAAVPLRLENQYFVLDINSPAGQQMLDAGHCVFYVPGSLGEVKLELFVVLRT